MDNSIVQKIKDELAKNDNIAVAVGKNPTIDEMAAALSFYLLLRQSNKKVSIASPTRPIVELSNLIGIDKVQGRLNGQEGNDLVVSFPYVEGEIEKVSYTLEKGYLNIIVKAAAQGLTFDEKDVRYTKGGGGAGGALSLLIVIGTPDLASLGDLITPEKLHDAKIINIDNKPENQGFGDLVAVSTEYSSLCEQVADIVLSLGFRPDRDVAQNLLDGITFSTNNFQEEKTSPLAFEIASLLMRNGARRIPQGISRSQPAHRPALPQRPQPTRQVSQAPRYNPNQPEPDDETSTRPQPRRQTSQSARYNPNDPDQNITSMPQPTRQANQSARYYPNEEPEPDEDNRNGRQNTDNQEETPNDWLGPKVYKGSSNF
jgi:hypothetical protein